MKPKTTERIEGSELYDKFSTIGETIFIIVAVGWFTWVFTDGFLWIAIFGAGFYLGNLPHRNNGSEEESCQLA